MCKQQIPTYVCFSKSKHCLWFWLKMLLLHILICFLCQLLVLIHGIRHDCIFIKWLHILVTKLQFTWISIVRIVGLAFIHGRISWPLRSADLVLLDFSLWGIMEENAYRTIVRNTWQTPASDYKCCVYRRIPHNVSVGSKLLFEAFKAVDWKLADILNSCQIRHIKCSNKFI
jgi:hypothetical protein